MTVSVTVQDDTGEVAGANSYISVADADTYFTNRANASWTGTDEEKSIALIKAWQYMDYAYNFIGIKLTEDQTTEWPRQSAYTTRGDSIDVVPTAVKYAQCEYAVRALSAELLQDITYDSNKNITKEKKKVGPIETDTSYGGYVINRTYPAADVLLKDLTISGMSVTRG